MQWYQWEWENILKNVHSSSKQDKMYGIMYMLG